MKKQTPIASEPSWLDRNDRKTPFTDAELDVLADDFIARLAEGAQLDVSIALPGWRIRVALGCADQQDSILQPTS